MEIESVFSQAYEKLKDFGNLRGKRQKDLADYVSLFEKEYKEISKESKVLESL